MYLGRSGGSASRLAGTHCLSVVSPKPTLDAAHVCWLEGAFLLYTSLCASALDGVHHYSLPSSLLLPLLPKRKTKHEAKVCDGKVAVTGLLVPWS